VEGEDAGGAFGTDRGCGVLITVPIYDTPVESSGFHRFCAHVKNDADTAIYGVGAATCPWRAAWRACVMYRKFRRRVMKAEYGDATLFAAMRGGA